MLGSFMEEMNITPEQFEIACIEGKNLNALALDEPSDNHSFSFHKGLFQQIWAANDIRIFVRLMVQRNVEIQLQALDFIERRQVLKTEEENKSIELSETLQIEKFVETELDPKIDASEEPNDDKFKRLNLFFEQDPEESDIDQRKEYLRAQRDKILQVKKQTRARQLNAVSDKERPTSSRKAAQKVINGENVSASDESSVQLRRLLAKKLREEVVDKAE